MSNFGERKGNMEKSVYDSNDDGTVDDSAQLEGESLSEVQDHTPKAHTHDEADITDLSHDALKIAGVTVDDTDKADGKVLQYSSSSQKLEYETPSPAGAHKTTHEDGGADEITCAGLVGRINFVDRGDPAAWDFSVGNLTTDGDYHDLDLSGILPEGAIAVVLGAYVSDDAAASYVLFREKGNNNGYNTFGIYTQVAGIAVQGEGHIRCDANRAIQYRASNTTFTNISLLVRGWFI